MGNESPDFLSAALLRPLAQAEDLLARLDERVAQSPLGPGFVARQHFAEAASALWLEGELVHVEDLVLHDARMDARPPTHEITRAHRVLRARRRIAVNAPDWALSPAGLGALAAREGEGAPAPVPLAMPSAPLKDDTAAAEEGPLAAELAEIDAVLARAGRTLAAEKAPAAPWPLPSPAGEPDPSIPGAAALGALLPDPERDERALLGEWLATKRRGETQELPPVLAAFLAWDAWERLEPLERQHWLGHLLAASLLRECGKASAHLPGLAGALRAVPRERRRSREVAVRCAAFLEGLSAAARAGLKEIERLELAAVRLERRTRAKRSNSRLPRLVELVLARPVVSAGLVAAELKITQRAALNLLAELGLSEVTGRGRYRAWGIV